MQRYYQFLLEAQSRLGREGRVLPAPPPILRKRRNSKVARAALSRVFPWARAKRRALEAAARGLGPDARLILEFGVHTGRSLIQLSRWVPTATIYGFDSFEGFPEDGRDDWPLDFAVEKLPEVPPSVKLVAGYFDDTVAPFRRETLDDGKTQVDLAHIDCDLYSSTRSVFEGLGEALRPGTVLVFDELLHYRRFLENEALAFFEFLEARGLDFEWAASHANAMPLAEFCSLAAKGALPQSAAAWRAKGYYQDAAVRLIERPADYEARLAPFADEAARLAALRPLDQPLAKTR